MTKSAIKVGGSKSSGVQKLQRPEGLAKKLDNEQGICIVSSSKDDQESWQMPGDPISLFTMCLLEVLQGDHDPNFRDPFVKMTDTVKYILMRVPERQPKQTPFANLQMYSDFILSKVPRNLNGNSTEAISEIDSNSTSVSKSNTGVENFRKTENATNLIVFVHGFSGQANDTFGNIPHLIKDEEDLKGWDILPFGYSKYANPDLGNNVWASLYNIKHASDNLTASVKYQFDQYHRIALVAHGSAGLVVQQSIIDLPDDLRKKISHVILFASPNNGIPEEVVKNLENPKLKEISENSEFIKNLRDEWNTTFKEGYPFRLRAVAATNDEYIPISSSLEVFPKKNQVVVGGNHFSMVDVKDEYNDSYNLIINELTDNEFYQKYTSKEEINILLGEYQKVVDELLPQKDSINIKGLKNLIFALEGLDRREEVLDILQNHPLAKDNTDVLGLLGGRYKRQYLKNFSQEDGQKAMEFYQRGLEISEKKGNYEQVYYHSINLAFMSLMLEEDKSSMRDYAEKALEATENDPFDSLWKLSTIAEANLYMGKFKVAKEYYQKASQMSDIRQKISIYTNAYAAYSNLMDTQSREDEFIQFLNNAFLK